VDANALPLLGVFTRLRQDHGLPLGMDEYRLALEALHGGFGVADRAALAWLCATLWAATPEEAGLVRRVLDEELAAFAATTQPAAPLPPPDSPAKKDPPEETPPDVPIGDPPVPPDPLPKPGPLRLPDTPTMLPTAGGSPAEGPERGRPRGYSRAMYYPVTDRQMKQGWRALRRPVNEGYSDEVDVPATVQAIERSGVLLEPARLPRRVNRAELVLLVDQGGSMVPFHFLSRQLIATAARGGRLGRTGVYYFHDYPDRYLYRDPARVEAVALDRALAALSERTAVLIVSDAGAARGHLDAERVAATAEFLARLRGAVRYYAWLNPLPNSRWAGTSAGPIAAQVPMFEMSQSGLAAALSTLRGRYVYWEKRYAWMTP